MVKYMQELLKVYLKMQHGINLTIAYEENGVETTKDINYEDIVKSRIKK